VARRRASHCVLLRIPHACSASLHPCIAKRSKKMAGLKHFSSILKRSVVAAKLSRQVPRCAGEQEKSVLIQNLPTVRRFNSDTWGKGNDEDLERPATPWVRTVSRSVRDSTALYSSLILTPLGCSLIQKFQHFVLGLGRKKASVHGLLHASCLHDCRLPLDFLSGPGNMMGQRDIVKRMDNRE
jgi:hypothetical protein